MKITDENRKSYLDCTRAVGILLMMLGHLLDSDSALKMIIYSFHMPLFFIVSGWNLKAGDFTVNCKHKFQRLYIPYIVWTFIFTKFAITRIMFVLYGTIEALEYIFTKKILWFLPCLFWATVIGGGYLSFFLQKKYRKYLLIVGIAIFFLLSLFLSSFHNYFQIDNTVLGFPCALDIVCLAVSFLLTGKLGEEYIMPRLKEINRILSFFIILFLLSFSLMGLFQKTKHGYQQMASFDIGNSCAFLLSGITVSMGILMMFERICRKYSCGVLQWIGRHSLLIYILSAVVLKYFREVYVEHRNAAVLLIVMIGMTVFTCGLTVLIEKIFYQNNKG